MGGSHTNMSPSASASKGDRKWPYGAWAAGCSEKRSGREGRTAAVVAKQAVPSLSPQRAPTRARRIRLQGVQEGKSQGLQLELPPLEASVAEAGATPIHRLLFVGAEHKTRREHAPFSPTFAQRAAHRLHTDTVAQTGCLWSFTSPCSHPYRLRCRNRKMQQLQCASLSPSLNLPRSNRPQPGLATCSPLSRSSKRHPSLRRGHTHTSVLGLALGSLGS